MLQLVVYFGVQILVLGLSILWVRRHLAAVVAWTSRWSRWILALLLLYMVYLVSR